MSIKSGTDFNTSGSNAPTQGLALLVVDDDPVSRKMLLAYLGRFFALVFCAKDGIEGFELLL